MTDTSLRPDAERKDYNVVLICLEGFSKYIMEEKGHVKGVTPNLDRLTREGIYFSNIYANSFRTDRAMVAVMSALPAQPTMSVMDMTRISTSLPSLAGALGKNGYDTHFYYGGDANYSNMKSYLMGTGFQNVTHQFDFDKKLQVYGSYEWQTGANVQNASSSVLNSYEYGTSLSLDYPYIKLGRLARPFLRKGLSSTSFKLEADWQLRAVQAHFRAEDKHRPELQSL